MSAHPGNANLPIGIFSGANQEIGVPRDAWRSRGYLPHLESADVIQHVSFHLADSLPKSVLERLDIELKAFPRKTGMSNGARDSMPGSMPATVHVSCGSQSLRRW